MSYFDHVRCHACRAMLNPEALGRVQGQGLSCPQCGAALSLTDLFGLSASFAEEEAEDLSLDDLVTGPSRPAAPPPPPRRSPPPPASAGALVRRGAPDDDDGGGSEALDLMRQLKRKKR